MIEMLKYLNLHRVALFVLPYIVTMSANAQSDTTTIGITQLPPKPIIEGKTIITEGESNSFSVNNCTGTVKWSNGQIGKQLTVTPKKTETYYAHCDNNGCKGDSSQIVLNVLVATPSIITNASTICIGETSTLTASGCESYLWSTGETNSQINVSPTLTSTYKVSCISVNGNGSGTERSILINVLSRPKKPTISGNSQPTLGDYFSLNSNCAVNEKAIWSTGDTTLVITKRASQSETISCNCISKETGCSSEKASFNLVVQVPSITLTASKLTVCSGDIASITVSGCPTNVSWSTGESINTIYVIVNQTTTYTAMCQFSNGVSKASVTITANPLPNTPTIRNSNPNILAGKTSVLKVVGCDNMEKEWEAYGSIISTNIDSIVVSPKNTNTFKVRCKNSTGCYSQKIETTVTVYTSDTKLIATKYTICSGDTTTIISNNCAGTISWSNSNSTAKKIVVQPSVTTTYYSYCKIANGVIDTSLIKIEVNPIMKIGVSASYQNTALTASDSLISNSLVTLSATGCTNGTVTWNIGTIGEKIQVYPVATTSYIAYCTTTTGCVTQASYTVKVKITNIKLTVSKSSVCAGNYSTLNASGCPNNIDWIFNSNDVSDVIKSASSISFKPINNTKVVASCKVTNIQTIKDSTNITVLPITKIVGKQATVCQNSAVDLSTLISNLSNFQNVVYKPNRIINSGISGGEYMVIGTNNNGCIDSTLVSVTVEKPFDKPIIEGINVISYGQSANLKVTNCTGKLEWIGLQSGANPLLVQPSTTTTYKAICRNNIGCVSDTASYTVNVVTQNAKIASPTFMCPDTQFRISTNCASATIWGEKSAYYTSDNELIITIPSSGDAVSIDGKDIFKKETRNDSTFVVVKASCLYIDEANTFTSNPSVFEIFVPSIVPSDFYFYPNPANDWIKIGSSSCFSSNFHVNIWDMIGRKVISIPSTEMKENKIDISQLLSGEFIVEIILQNGKVIKKLLKNNN